MTTRIADVQFIAANEVWFWPFYYVGLGFLLSASLIACAYFVHHLRSAAAVGKLPAKLAEFLIMLFFVPSIAGIFAVITAFNFTKSLDDSYYFILCPAVSLGLVWLAWRLAPKGTVIQQ
jgi:hypothetical protein